MSLTDLINSLHDASEYGYYNVGVTGVQKYWDEDFQKAFEIKHFCTVQGLDPPSLDESLLAFEVVRESISRFAKANWGNSGSHISVDGGLDDRTIRLGWNMRDGTLDFEIANHVQKLLASSLPEWRVVIPLEPDAESLIIYPIAIVHPKSSVENLEQFLSRKREAIALRKDSLYIQNRNFSVIKPMLPSLIDPSETKFFRVVAAFDTFTLGKQQIIVCVVHDANYSESYYFCHLDEFLPPAYAESYNGAGGDRFLTKDFGETPNKVTALDDTQTKIEFLQVHFTKEKFQGYIIARDHDLEETLIYQVDVPIWNDTQADEMYRAVTSKR